MKKRLMAIAAVAALALNTCAWGETTLEQVGTIDFSDDWIDGTNLLEAQDSAGNVALADMNGGILSAYAYYRLGSSTGYGLISAISANASSANSMGALNLSGQEVIPCSYGDIRFLNEHWTKAVVLKEATKDNYDYNSWFSDDVYLIDTVDFYYTGDDGAVTKVGSLTRENYMDDNAYGRYINIEDRASGSITTYDGTWTAVVSDEPADSIYDEVAGADDSVKSYRENGQYGLKDAAGNVILGPTFGYMESFRAGYAEVENNLESGDVKGLIDEAGNLVVPVEFDDINTAYCAPATAENGYSTTAYNNFGYFCVTKDNKLGYVDSNGAVSCDFTIAKDNCDNNGASATYTDMGGAMHILAADGVDTDVSQYDRVSVMYGGSGMYYKVSDADYNYGVIDWHGNVIVEIKYSSIDMSGDGQYLLLQEDYNTPCELVKLVYTADGAAAAPAEEAPAEEAPAEEAPAEEAPAEEAPAGEAPAEEGAAAADTSAIAGLIDSAITLANTDAAANAGAIRNLLQSASDQIAQSHPEVKTIIDSAISLLDGANIDGASIATVLSSAKTLLG